MLFTLLGGAATATLALALAKLKTRHALQGMDPAVAFPSAGRTQESGDLDNGTIYSAFI
jgi:hypothetical protein